MCVSFASVYPSVVRNIIGVYAQMLLVVVSGFVALTSYFRLNEFLANLAPNMGTVCHYDSANTVILIIVTFLQLLRFQVFRYRDSIKRMYSVTR